MAGLETIFAFLGIFMLFFFLLGLGLYIYSSLALMAIAKRTNTPYPWLAWIPIANVYLLTQIAGVPGILTFVFLLLPLAPTLALKISGSLGFVIALVWVFVSLVAWIWLFWRICEERKRPGWWGILIVLVPLVNLILLGILAWSKES